MNIKNNIRTILISMVSLWMLMDSEIMESVDKLYWIKENGAFVARYT